MQDQTDRAVLNARDLQQPPYEFNRATAYEVLRKIGVRISPRRTVVSRERLEEFLRGEVA